MCLCVSVTHDTNPTAKEGGPHVVEWSVERGEGAHMREWAKGKILSSEELLAAFALGRRRRRTALLQPVSYTERDSFADKASSLEGTHSSSSLSRLYLGQNYAHTHTDRRRNFTPTPFVCCVCAVTRMHRPGEKSKHCV